ncbi:RING-H2 finger protein ATL79-like [Phoenix dactylifera]|uniref:RING-H2 finger protein ATL79-like n=1 Tax=Phoenix dactylifera TaxID=42345 RepID=A0A8B7C4K6_PHODC|nr:RING-H2 finger protein ATL79-like [Phoenix dactylifera]
MPSPIQTEAVLHSPPPHPSSPPSSPSNKWAPYSSAKDFDTNMATILVVLVCATILAFSLHAAARCLLSRCLRRRRHDDHHETPADEKGKSGSETAALAEALPSVVYTAETRLAGAEAECAICLAEFAEGEHVRVLPACNHGFHVKCVQAWLASRPSCPTCRATVAAGDLLEEP